MRKMLVFMSLVLSFAMLLTLPAMTFADEEEEVNLEKEIEIEEEEEEGKGPKKEWLMIKKALQAQKRLIEADKDLIESQIEELELQLEAAEESGDTTLIEAIKAQIEELKESFWGHKEIMMLKIREMQQVMREKYTLEEWNSLMLNAEALEGYPDIKVLPAENILMPGKNLKFDVPPVIKEGRLLVPIRAISAALGAEVDWDSKTKTATIVYGDTTIIFMISEGTITVNDEPVELDVDAEVIGGRIVVPLRFIVENMGLEIEWDQETETAEITDPAEVIE